MTMNAFIAGNMAAGKHYFDKSTMRFFRSRVVKDSFCSDGYFITSEQYETNTERRYTIRCGNIVTFDVSSVSEFMQYATLRDARKALKALRIAEFATN